MEIDRAELPLDRVVTGSAQKVLHRKNLKTGIGCRQSDWASGARNLQDQPQPRVLINLTGIDQNKPSQYVLPKHADQSCQYRMGHLSQ